MKPTLMLIAVVTALGFVLTACDNQPDGPTGDSHKSSTADGSESPETNLQNNTGNTNTQAPEDNANDHSVARSYCLPDETGMRVYVWSRQEWSPTVIYTHGLPDGNLARC